MARATATRYCQAIVAPPADGEVRDLRIRSLLGADAWARLPATVQARFSKRYADGLSVTYAGRIARCRMSVGGWLLAQACRLIGGPLPVHCDTGMAAVVTVTEHGPDGGQVWTRMYARRRGTPQVIHSVKRFRGPTGLEEYLGFGFGIALRVDACAEGIGFVSDHYFLELGAVRLRLPEWLTPGRLRIDHVDRGAGRFDFVLNLCHPLFGLLIDQVGRFQDRPMTVQGAFR